MSFEEAQSTVDGLKDRLGRPIDPGIAEALTQFVRFAKALGFQTVQSCEGYIDWGLPFPWIDFEVPHEKVELPSSWKVWKFKQWTRMKREDEKHLRNEEKKTDQLCAMMTRHLMSHHALHGISLDTALRIERWQQLRFRLLPAYEWISEGQKMSGETSELNKLLALQRWTMKSFASFCVSRLESEPNLVGIPDEGCRGCMGRG